MSAETNIAWCDATFNPWIGCTKVSPGCANCYAETLDRNRYSKTLGAGSKAHPVSHWGPRAPRHRTSIANWRQPITWDALATTPDHSWHPGHRPRVFCASLADWLDPEVPVAWLGELLSLIIKCSQLDWLLLTKRPEHWRSRLEAVHEWAMQNGESAVVGWVEAWLAGKAPANVWIGTTVEDQARADARRELLRTIPAWIHFVSYEPALEQVDWSGWEFVDWLIMGGESGANARSTQVEWFRAALYWCREHRVAPFVKQLGAHVFTQNANALDWPEATEFEECGGAGFAESRVDIADRMGGDLEEFPTEFQVREFPTAKGAAA